MAGMEMYPRYPHNQLGISARRVESKYGSGEVSFSEVVSQARSPSKALEDAPQDGKFTLG
jgi:hypothetical protein